MKALRMTALLSALLIPVSANAHPGHSAFLADLVHAFARLDPLLMISGLVLIVSGVAWRMRRSRA